MSEGVAIAQAMRDLSDEERDRLILAAGDKVADRRGFFESRRRQIELAKSYK